MRGWQIRFLGSAFFAICYLGVFHGPRVCPQPSLWRFTLDIFDYSVTTLQTLLSCRRRSAKVDETRSWSSPTAGFTISKSSSSEKKTQKQKRITQNNSSQILTCEVLLKVEVLGVKLITSQVWLKPAWNLDGSNDSVLFLRTPLQAFCKPS